MTQESQISKFYASKKILITGSTGFMGKVLLWKLLYSCPELDTIYVLMRSKYGTSSMSRKKQLFESPVFENLIKTNPKIVEKVVIISGDVGQDGLGLSNVDRNTFIEHISIIFHGAAILKMNLDLRTSVNVNTVGTIRMLDMAQKMKKLQAFVYISTAYCCCENKTVEEKIYPSKQNPYDIINVVNWMEPDMLNKITEKLIHPLPNTYTYSKRLTESVLNDYVSKVPIIVARPGIVVPSTKEPFPGWCDSLNGPTGLFVAGGRGIMRTTLLNLETKSDIIPVDTTIDSIIILPWANSREQLLEQISVYNITQNSPSITWGEMTDKITNALHKYPLNLVYWYPATSKAATRSKFVYNLKIIILHYLPAYIIDFILQLCGQKPFLVKVYDRLRLGEKMLAYFADRRWIFVHDNLLQLEEQMNDADKQLFTVNMNEMGNFDDYFDRSMRTFKVHVFKEDLNKLGQARITMKIMYVLDKIMLALRYYLIWKFFVFIFNTVFSTYVIH